MSIETQGLTPDEVLKLAKLRQKLDRDAAEANPGWSDDGSKDMKAQAVIRGYAHYEADPKTGKPIFQWNDNPDAPAPEKAERP